MAFAFESINCPYCDELCEADWVDVGVGFIQCGPYHCEACGASQIGPYDQERLLTDKEKETGWYGPGQPPGSSANVIDGKVVSSKEMLRVYKATFTGNPRYNIPGYVERWFKFMRGE